jgi:hypothetical protein
MLMFKKPLCAKKGQPSGVETLYPLAGFAGGSGPCGHVFPAILLLRYKEISAGSAAWRKGG